MLAVEEDRIAMGADRHLTPTSHHRHLTIDISPPSSHLRHLTSVTLTSDTLTSDTSTSDTSTSDILPPTLLPPTPPPPTSHLRHLHLRLSHLRHLTSASSTWPSSRSVGTVEDEVRIGRAKADARAGQ
ncbi:uncharacterized protein MYCGRDRAFT_98078 [Zymoseptoria tritici IPO323]|uniref:Uncharacterized protein n=1 Tax=Zymoseptoria tritici (strain CBS 115943 / IPO323) TaxID=336722 RepID=F9XS89_ZYMTI|nr:uncharacterized protein MYCGRDRAFT_98078 [Zymoseptoria tritici IPO323]EGP81828.1 hypothetical protein MYCGRDRAFT_98078 [Zymoseptoria tritici IPO323]